MNLASIFNKKITLDAGLIIIGILFVFVSIMGALYLGSWLMGPIWQGSQPPIDNFATAVIPSSTSPLEIIASETPAVTATITATPTYTSTPLGSSSTPRPDDWANLVSSSPVDGINLAPSSPFTKVWTIKNVGQTTWTTDYDLVFINGTRMINKQVYPLPVQVKPGKTIEISLPQISPKIPGSYQGFWMLSNKSGEIFGIGDQADQPLKVNITVLNVDPNNSYDFLLNYCQAEWWNSKGEKIKCPGEPRQISGFVLLSTEPRLENGISDKPVLWVHPNNISKGIISGKYPAYTVKNGDHFKAKVGCIGGYAKCSVNFKLLYKIGNNPDQILGSWKELSGGGITPIDVDLSSLEGQRVQFILRMTCSNNYPDSAQGFWMTPRIVYLKPTTTPTATNTLTPTPTATNTLTPTPTATNTLTPTPTATDTLTPTPTATDTLTPTPTATDTLTPTPTDTTVPPPAP